MAKIDKEDIADALKEDNPIKDLQAHLEKNPGIQRIYFNEKGEWIFHRRPDFPIEKDREDVLDAKFSLDDEELFTAKKKQPNKVKTVTEQTQETNAALPVYDITKKYTPEQLAAYINAAKNAEEVNLYMREDNKPETSELIRNKIASFSKK